MEMMGEVKEDITHVDPIHLPHFHLPFKHNRHPGLEKQFTLSVHERLDRHGLTVVDGERICWKDQSEFHPRYWSPRAKLYNTAFMMLYESFGAAMSTVCSSAATQARFEYGLSIQSAYFIFTTLPIIGELLASFILPPISESFGRKRPFVVTSILLIISLGITTIPKLPAVYVGRFLCGFLGMVTPCISAGALEDIYTPQQRTWGLFVYTSASNTGLVVGPILSSYIIDSLSWRWIYYIGMIYSLFIFIASYEFRESRPNLLLERQFKKVIEEVGDIDLKFENPDLAPSLRVFIQEAITQPIYLFWTEPIIAICSILRGIAFGLVYGLTEALTIVYMSFGFSAASSSLSFIALFVGMILCFLPRWYDQRVLQNLTVKDMLDLPEIKMRSFAVSAPVLALGLWLFAWTIPPLIVDVPWIISMLGLVAVGFSTADFDYILCGYLVDSYTSYAASALAAQSILRCFISIIFTSTAASFYTKLGSNYATTILACLATIFCVSPFIILRYGRRLRERSQFARYSADMAEMNMAHPAAEIEPITKFTAVQWQESTSQTTIVGGRPARVSFTIQEIEASSPISPANKRTAVFDWAVPGQNNGKKTATASVRELDDDSTDDESTEDHSIDIKSDDMLEAQGAQTYETVPTTHHSSHSLVRNHEQPLFHLPLLLHPRLPHIHTHIHPQATIPERAYSLDFGVVVEEDLEASDTPSGALRPRKLSIVARTHHSPQHRSWLAMSKWRFSRRHVRMNSLAAGALDSEAGEGEERHASRWAAARQRNMTC